MKTTIFWIVLFHAFFLITTPVKAIQIKIGNDGDCRFINELAEEMMNEFFPEYEFLGEVLEDDDLPASMNDEDLEFLSELLEGFEFCSKEFISDSDFFVDDSIDGSESGSGFRPGRARVWYVNGGAAALARSLARSSGGGAGRAGKSVASNGGKVQSGRASGGNTMSGFSKSNTSSQNRSSNNRSESSNNKPNFQGDNKKHRGKTFSDGPKISSRNSHSSKNKENVKSRGSSSEKSSGNRSSTQRGTSEKSAGHTKSGSSSSMNSSVSSSSTKSRSGQKSNPSGGSGEKKLAQSNSGRGGNSQKGTSSNSQGDGAGKISRRNFLKGAGASVAGLGAAAKSTGPAAARGKPTRNIQNGKEVKTPFEQRMHNKRLKILKDGLRREKKFFEDKIWKMFQRDFGK